MDESGRVTSADTQVGEVYHVRTLNDLSEFPETVDLSEIANVFTTYFNNTSAVKIMSVVNICVIFRKFLEPSDVPEDFGRYPRLEAR